MQTAKETKHYMMLVNTEIPYRKYKRIIFHPALPNQIWKTTKNYDDYK